MEEEKRYGLRWIVETASLYIKRMFGEYVMAARFQKMIKEMMMIIKISLYNMFRRIV